MKYNHDEFRELLYQAATGALQRHANLISDLEAKHRTTWCSGLWAMSYDVLMWIPQVTISFRTFADADRTETRYSPPDWQGYQLIGSLNEPQLLGGLSPLLQYAGDAYSSVCHDPRLVQELNHLAYFAAADVLLDRRIAELLQSCNAPASIIESQIPYQEFGLFEYVVLDADGAFKGNYCEMLCAHRVVRRLLGRELFATQS